MWDFLSTRHRCCGQHLPDGDADCRVNDGVRGGEKFFEIIGASAWNCDYLDTVAYCPQADGQSLGLVFAYVRFDEVLSDEQPARYSCIITQDNFRNAGAGDKLGNPRAEAAATPDEYRLTPKCADGSLLVASGSNFWTFV
jgi:hypothetical protein